MAIFYNVNIYSSNPSTDGNGTAICLYYLKETLKSAGWKVLAASNGTTLTTYPSGTTGTDSISSIAMMNNTSAWFRITDPDSVREYVCMKGTSTNAIFKYSRQTKFASGSPNATTLPTTGASGDGAVLVGSSTDSGTTTSAQALPFIDSGAPAFVPTTYHFITDSTPTNSVYPWYMFGIEHTYKLINSCFYSHEAIQYGSCSPSDNDPSWFFSMAGGGSNAFANFDGTGQTATLSTSPARAWYKYGLVGAAFEKVIGLSYAGAFSAASKIFRIYPSETTIPNISGDSNPYNLKNTAMPILIRSVSYPKGLSTGMMWRGGKETFPTIVYLNNNYFICVGALAGQTNFLVPWPQNVFPKTGI